VTAGLTIEQVVALAPDAGAVKAGRGLATTRPWRTLGRSARVAWGECQGSAAQPYQVQADLAEPAFKCSCPSKKLPCKHALGLLLLLAEQPAALPPSEPPSWVGDWLAARARRAEQRTAKAERPAAETTAEAAAEASKRAASREQRVAAGLAELEQWLADLLRRGLASVQAEPARFWERPATRLVDAQAPGLARRVRELAGIPATGDGWQARLLERLAMLHLLVEGYRRLEALPPAVQADIRAQIGWTLREEEVLAGEATRDRWLVLGGRDGVEERLRVRRTWLWGAVSDRPALLLQFAHGSQPFEVALPAGLAIDAELTFFPGAYPLRALIKARHGSGHRLDGLPGHATLAEATAAYARALAANPWLEEFPLAVRGVRPMPADGCWIARDAEDRALPLAPRFASGWTLLALSGGDPVDLFGEWDGDALLPLGAWAGGRFVGL
jgi:SWIM zinc finger